MGKRQRGRRHIAWYRLCPDDGCFEIEMKINHISEQFKNNQGI